MDSPPTHPFPSLTPILIRIILNRAPVPTYARPELKVPPWIRIRHPSPVIIHNSSEVRRDAGEAIRAAGVWTRSVEPAHFLPVVDERRREVACSGVLEGLVDEAGLREGEEEGGDESEFHCGGGKSGHLGRYAQ